MYDASDEDFWADSESSEFDSGNSTDDELQDGVSSKSLSSQI